RGDVLVPRRGRGWRRRRGARRGRRGRGAGARRGDRLRSLPWIQNRVDDVDPRIAGLDSAADDLGGVVDLDVAALARHLDLGALLRGPLALQIVGAQQAEEDVVVVEL